MSNTAPVYIVIERLLAAKSSRLHAVAGKSTDPLYLEKHTRSASTPGESRHRRTPMLSARHRDRILTAPQQWNECKSRLP
jgi:hypothetical protein